jgi:YbbR domain-containing protein
LVKGACDVKLHVPREIYLKIAAVLLAVVVWFVAGAEINKTQTDTVERFITAGVDVVGAPSEFTVETRPRDVEVRVRGPKYLVEPLDGGRVRASVSVAGRGEGEYAARVQVSAPEGVQVVEIIPASVGVKMDAIVSADFPVRVGIIGYPGEGSVPLEPELSPRFVTVIGPRSQVESIEEVLAQIDVSGITSAISRSVKVNPQDAGGNLVLDLNIQPQTIRVFVPISKMSTAPLDAEESHEGLQESAEQGGGLGPLPD